MFLYQDCNYDDEEYMSYSSAFVVQWDYQSLSWVVMSIKKLPYAGDITTEVILEL